MASQLDGVTLSWHAVAIDDPTLEQGEGADDSVVPASVMKVLVALTGAVQLENGQLDATARVRLPVAPRTPGPVGFSLYADEIELSVRDLLVPVLTLSDNAATDVLIDLVGGMDAVNALAVQWGLTGTLITQPLQAMLDEMAHEVGFDDYLTLSGHEPAIDGRPTQSEVTQALETTSALDPSRGSHTTPRDMTTLLSGIWRDEVGPPQACSRVRQLMGAQLTQHRIASGFTPPFRVAAKSGGLMGVVRNEIGVVTGPSGRSCAVAIFTRRRSSSPDPGSAIDTLIGQVAREAFEELLGE